MTSGDTETNRAFAVQVTVCSFSNTLKLGWQALLPQVCINSVQSASGLIKPTDSFNALFSQGFFVLV